MNAMVESVEQAVARPAAGGGEAAAIVGRALDSWDRGTPGEKAGLAAVVLGMLAGVIWVFDRVAGRGVEYADGKRTIRVGPSPGGGWQSGQRRPARQLEEAGEAVVA